mmetsp:Transcript_2433/g.3232  ORF Transcript_2433/g.3232 Transcript_2433/m.3232 type:complete len:1406 (-) Transcript_2433:1253-5470(-)
MPAKEELPSTAATEELYHTNLLRLQANQLLSESILSLSSQTGLLENEVKWSNDVNNYIEKIKEIVGGIDPAVLSPSDVLMKSNEENKDEEGDRFLIKLHSDKAQRHVESDEETDKWKIPFPGGEFLQLCSINSYAANGAGLTTTSANANVIPTLDLAVLMPMKSRNDDDDDICGMVGGKDYLNGRYFDKRNILAIHIAKYLSQKKQRKQVGSVHVVNELDGDYRKVSLILTPPIPSDNIQASGKKRQKLDEKKRAKKNKKKKIHFQLRLVFGVQYDTASRNKIESNTGWIPNARLFPDRYNNKIVEVEGQLTTNDGTPNYNNSLSSDMHHLSTTQILASVSSSALKIFTESWTLLKIWCLQRGFLRGHDSFSEKSLGLTLAYLYRSKLVSTRMDSIQVFTVWMKFMSDMDWLGENDISQNRDNDDEDKFRHSSSQAYQKIDIQSTRGLKNRSGIVMPEYNMTEQQTVMNCVQNRLHASDVKGSDMDKVAPKTLLESYKVNSDSPIFLDPTMTENYFGNTSPSFIRELQIETRRALECIHVHGDHGTSTSSKCRIEPFRQLFLENMRFWKCYDAYLKLDLNDIVFPSKMNSKHQPMNFWGDDVQDLGSYEAISRGLVKVLHMALGDRVASLRILTTGNGDTTNMLDLNTDIGTKVLLDSDDIAYVPIRSTSETKFRGYKRGSIESAVANGSRQSKQIVIGVRINSDTCHRIVDRGPPADDTASTSTFVALWGESKAQLRRFKDGAIVHAVVWNDIESKPERGRIHFEDGSRFGDIVERIIRHIIRVQFNKLDAQEMPCPLFSLRNIVSLVEGTSQEEGNDIDCQMRGSDKAHKRIATAFQSLTEFLRKNTVLSTNALGVSSSTLGLPLSIDAVEALCPSLRYAQVFPPLPHPLLGGATDTSTTKRVAGAIHGDPVLIQIRFEGSSKWPQDINAMSAAKCAMLMQLAEGIEKMKQQGDSSGSQFDGPINVTPTHLDLGYSGYVFRIVVRADEELKMLNALRNPSQEAEILKQVLRKRHVVSAAHHFTIHGLHTKYPASAGVSRLMKRWLAAHMISGLIPPEAIELLVASVFTDPAPFHTPTTVPCGFMRCLHLLSIHNWSREPLIVDPEGHIDPEERSQILMMFENLRGPEYKNGPPMFIISPVDRNEDDNSWKPSFTVNTPERVVLARISALAKRSFDFLHVSLRNLNSTRDNNEWVGIFQESSSALKSYSSLLRVDREFVCDTECASTGGDLNTFEKEGLVMTPYHRSMEKRLLGPKLLKKKLYKNLIASDNSFILSWNPVQEAVARLRSELGHLALFFYNEYTPDIIAMVWRPDAFKPSSFSAMCSEYRRPIGNVWEENSLVVTNASDAMRVIKFLVRDIVTDVKILDDRQFVKSKGKSSSKRKHSPTSKNDIEESSSDDTDDN